MEDKDGKILGEQLMKHLELSTKLFEYHTQLFEKHTDIIESLCNRVNRLFIICCLLSIGLISLVLPRLLN